MDDTQAFLNQDYRHADRFMLFLVWGLFVMGLGLSGMHDTLKWAFMIGLPLAAIPTTLILMLPGSLLTRAVVAFALMAFTALHIHQAAGVTELHFGVFVLLAFLVCYRDWKVIVIAAGVIAVHHLLFNYLQEWGYGVLCFTEPGIGRVASHAAYVVGESAVLCYLAVLLRQDALRSAELHLYIKDLAENDRGIIDLSAHRSAAISDAGKILDDMVAKLRTSIASVQQGAESISQAAQEIAAGNDDLEAQTRLQSQSLVDTASSMEKMTEAVRNNADNARRANELAASASDVASRGGEVVSKVVATMGSINDSSKKITDIIGVIDGIAFQTNILALNAAVEAARAGEQGRGFAVVAAEVRNLAQRSAAAAKDIKNLISDSVQKADTGSKLVSEAGSTMEEIVTEIRRVTDLMSEIVAVSHTQSDGIEQVDRARREMDEVAQQNAGLVEQRANAAHRLQEQAENLARAVSIFRLNEAALRSGRATQTGRPTLRVM